MTNTAEKYALKELNLETTFGGMGKEVERDVPVIDLTDFDQRREEITDQLWQAATESQRTRAKAHWRRLYPRLAGSTTRWTQGKGPLSGTWLTLLDIGWKPVSATVWFTDVWSRGSVVNVV